MCPAHPAETPTHHTRFLASLAITILFAVSCDGAGTPQSSEGAASPGPTTPAVQASPLPTGPLSPGAYSFEFSGFGVSFELGPGWLNENQIPEQAFELVLGEAVEPPDRQAITVFLTPGSPDQVVTQVEDVRDLAVESTAEAEIGGRSGTRLEVTVAEGAEHASIMQIGNEQGPDYFLSSGNLGHITVLDVDGQAVVVAQEALAEEFDGFATAADDVLASMTFV